MSSRRRVESLPVFPLTGTLMLPGIHLPLNIFEPRYLAMVRDALEGERAIGMIQPEVPGLDNWGITPAAAGEPKLYPVGCKGRIVEDRLQEDGRYHIVLEGVSRFRVVRELESVRGYRRVEADLAEFDLDASPGAVAVDTTTLRAALESYARRKGLEIDADLAATLPGVRLVNLLSTALPFSPAEKQALLEARSTQDRAELLTTLIDIEIEATPRSPAPPTVH
jgi:Lon protease-like protein